MNMRCLPWIVDVQICCKIQQCTLFSCWFLNGILSMNCMVDSTSAMKQHRQPYLDFQHDVIPSNLFIKWTKKKRKEKIIHRNYPTTIVNVNCQLITNHLCSEHYLFPWLIVPFQPFHRHIRYYCQHPLAMHNGFHAIHPSTFSWNNANPSDHEWVMHDLLPNIRSSNWTFHCQHRLDFACIYRKYGTKDEVTWHSNLWTNNCQS